MTTDSTTSDGDANLFPGAAWFDPIEAGIRGRIRGFIEALIEQELAAALGRTRYQRRPGVTAGTEAPADTSGAGDAADPPPPIAGHRHGRRARRLVGSFGAVEIAVPRARLRGEGGAAREWRSAVLPRYARRTRQVEALIAGAYLAGTNTRRVRRALTALFEGAISKDTVSRVGRKVKADWEAWSKRSLAGEDMVRLILDGTVVRARLDRRATTISLPVVLGVRRDGRRVLLAVRNMGGESEAAWRAGRARRAHRARPEDAGVPHRRWRRRPRAGARRPVAGGADPAVHGAQAPQPRGPRPRPPARGGVGRLHRHALRRHGGGGRGAAHGLPPQVAAQVPRGRRQPGGGRRQTLHLHPPAAGPVEVAARTTNAVERLHEESKRRIKTRTVPPSPETAAMLFRALLASGQITMRKVDGWPTLAQRPADAAIDLAA